MQSKKNFLFIIFNLVLLVGILQSYSFFKDYFSESKDFVKQAHQLKDEVEKEKLKTAMIQNQLSDLRQGLASALPIQDFKIKNKNEYQIKMLSQVLRQPSSLKGLDFSSVVLQAGKTAFKEKNYHLAAEKFKELNLKYPSSPRVIESYFLLAESYFQESRYEDCLDVALEMVNHYPQSEMTGYILLRQAQILKMRRRTVEAAETYKIVMSAFPQGELSHQAKELLKEIEIK